MELSNAHMLVSLIVGEHVVMVHCVHVLTLLCCGHGSCICGRCCC